MPASGARAPLPAKLLADYHELLALAGVIEDFSAPHDARPPSISQLNKLLADPAIASTGGPPCSVNDKKISFVNQSELEASEAYERNYEARIAATGQVATRAGHWHDVFNALVWCRYPRLKSAINQLHYLELAALGAESQNSGTRGPVRDFLTLLDESGVLLVCTEPALAEALRQHDWRMLFWQHRQAWGHSIIPVIVGHALLEKALSPFPGITAQTLIVPATGKIFTKEQEGTPAARDSESSQPLSGAMRRHLDQHVASWLLEQHKNLASTMLTPLPLPGIPGWAPGQCEEFYVDQSVFRPLRRQPRGVESAVLDFTTLNPAL